MKKNRKNISPFDPELDKYWIEWRNVHGMYEIALYSHRFMSPVGLCWGLAAARGNTNEPRFEIIHAYTIEFARRKGVQRKIREWIFSAWKGRSAIQRISTPDASKHGGLEAMKRMGYKQIKAADSWVLTREAFEKSSQKKA